MWTRLAFLQLFLCASSLAWAIDYQSNTLGSSGAWTTAASWTPVGVPGAGDNVVILSGHTIAITNDNQQVNNLAIDAGGRLNINDQRELTANGNVTLNGIVEFFDGGAIESLGLSMAGLNKVLSGTGLLITNAAINNGQSNPHVKFANTTSISASADLTFTCTCTGSNYTNLVRIENNIVVTNNGRITISKALVGNNASSQWVNKAGSSVRVAEGVLSTGILTASEAGNTVEYTGSITQNIKVPATTYSNLKLSGSGIKDLVSSVTVGGDVTIAGILRANANTLTVGGNWSNTGTLQAGTGTVVFNGSSDQTLVNPTGEVFNNLTINKGTSSTLNLSNNITVGSLLTLTNSSIDAGSSKVTIGISSAQIGTLSQTGTSYIIGQVERWFNGTFSNTVFPIAAQDGTYRPVRLSFNTLSSSGSLLAEFISGNPGSISNPPLNDSGFDLNSLFATGFWRLQGLNGISGSQYDLELTATGFTPFTIDDETRIVSRPVNTSTWSTDGAHNPLGFISPTVKRDDLTLLPAEFTLAKNTICSLPNTSAISGATSICTTPSGDTFNYSVTGTGGSTFSWEVVGGTISGGTGAGTVSSPSVLSGVNLTSITVDWGLIGGSGTIEVVEDNTASGGCGAGTPVTQTVTLNPVPTSPISGLSAVAFGQTGVLYSVTSTPSYTYNWSISGAGHSFTGNNSNQITVNWGTAAAGTYTITTTATNTSPCSSISASDVTYQVTVEGIIESTGITSDWNLTTSWSPAVVPTRYSNVRVKSGHTINVNIDNVEINSLEIQSGASLNINDQRELTAYGNLTLNGLVEFFDGGAIESLGLVMAGNGTTLSGTGRLITNVGINNGQTNPHFKFNANVTIDSSADLDFICTCTGSNYSNLVRIESDRIVTNLGRIFNNKSLAGNNANSKWINRSGASLSISEVMLSTGILDATELGNTVEYTGSVAQSIKVPVSSYGNLTIAGSGIKSLAGSTSVAGDLVITSTLNANANNLFLLGNWTNSGTFQDGGATVTFSGTTTQTITNSSGEIFNNLTLLKAGSSLVLAGNVQVKNTLNMQNVLVTTGSHVLTLGQSTASVGTLVRTSPATVIGKMERWINSTGTSINFPVGTASYYRPVDITFTNLTSGSLIAEFVASPPGTVSPQPLVDAAVDIYNLQPDGYWTLTKANNLESTGYDLQLTAQGFNSIPLSYASRILIRDTPVSSWAVNGNHVDTPGTFTSPVVKRSGVNLLSAQFAIGETDDCSFPTTAPIAGTSNTCINTSGLIYTTSGGTGSTFSWEVVGGTIVGGTGSGTTSSPSVRSAIDLVSITVNWGSAGGAGSVNVTENNLATGGCGDGTPQQLAVSINPGITSPITGSANVTVGQAGVSYSVTNVSGTEYDWSISGSGHSFTGGITNEIIVNWGTATAGNYTVSVTARNVSPCSNLPAAPVSFLVSVSSVIESTGVTSDWNLTTTWTSSRVPTQYDNVRIKSAHTVNVNIDNAETKGLEIQSSGLLNINDQRELFVYGDLTIDGTVEFLDGGAIESLGLVMLGNGTVLSGTGLVRTQMGINNGQVNPHFRFGANAIVSAAADLTFTCVCTGSNYTNLVRIDADKIVNNLGTLTINKSLVGASANSKWINKAGSTLKVSEGILSTGILDARESGNMVNYSGTGNQTIKNGLDNQYANLTIAGSGIKSLAAATEVTGDITISSNLNTNSFDLTLGGSWTNTGIFQEGTRTVNFTGGSNQTITSSSPEVFYRMVVNKTGGEIVLSNDVIVSNSLALNAGDINTQSSKFTLGTGVGVGQLGTLSVVSPNSVLGKFERWISNAAGNDNSTNALFPVGTASTTRAMTATFSGAPNTINGSLLAEFSTLNPGSNGLTLSDGTSTVFNTFYEGFWKLTTNNGLTCSNYALQLNADGFSSFSIATARVLTRATSSSPWTANGTHVASVGTVANRTGVSLLSAEYALGDINNCAQPSASAIIGDVEVCTNSAGVIYQSSGGLAGSTYTWEVVGGTIVGGSGLGTSGSPSTRTGVGLQNISVNWGVTGGFGQVSVVENNSFAPVFGCGAGAPIIQTININPLPTSAISGTTTLSPGQVDQVYSVTLLNNYDYSWEVVGGLIDGGTGAGTLLDPSVLSGAGANSVTVDWGTTPGTFSVSATATNTNPCGSVSAATVQLPVTIINEIVSTGVTADWNLATTWTANRVPTIFDNVRIAHTVNLNVDNAEVNDLTIDAGKILNINDQRELNVYGNLRLDGTVEFLDGGAIESNGLVMTGDGKVLSGTGLLRTQMGINNGQVNPHFKFGANVSIDASADLNFSCTCTGSNYTNLVRIESDKIVSNFGKVQIDKSLIGNNASSKWINSNGAVLRVAESLLATGILDASQASNSVDYYGSANQNVKVPEVSYYNLLTTGSGIKTLAGSIEVVNDITISSSLDVSTFDLSLGGDWTNTGSFTTGTRKVTLDGSADQTLTNASGETFYDLEVNKVSGTVIIPNSVTVSNQFIYKQGNINTQSNLLSVGTSALSEGSINLSGYVSGSVRGKIRRWVDTSAPHSFVFPVGTATDYRPVTIDFANVTTGGALIVEFLTSNPGGNGLPFTDGAYTVRNPFSEGYWSVTTPNPNTIAFTTFDVDVAATGFTSFAIDSETRLISRNSSVNPWVGNGTHQSPVGSTLQRNGIALLPLEFAGGDDTNCTQPATSAITKVLGNDCITNSSTYRVTNTPGSTYTWTVSGGSITSGQGNNQVTILWGATGGAYQLQVVENNSGGGGCGIGTPVSTTVSVSPLAISAISGVSQVAANSTGIAYSVTSLGAGYTYNWAGTTGGTVVGSGNSITINWGAGPVGTVRVFATGPCGFITATESLTVDISSEVVSNGTGPWNTGSSWAGGVVPQGTNSVRIRNGDIITLDIDNAVTNNLIIESSGRLNINDQREITVNGNLTLNGIVEFFDGGAIESLGLSMAGASAVLDGTGTLTTAASINNGQVNPLFKFNNNITIASTANLNFTCSCGASNYSDLVRIESNRVVTNNGTVSINQNLTGNNGNSQWVNKAGATLKVSEVLLGTGRLTASEAGNTVEYNGTINQAIKTPLTSTYSNLVLSGSGQKTMAAAFTASGNVTISGTADFRLNGFNLSVGGNWSRTGTFTPGANCVTFNGTSDQTIAATTFSCMSVNKPSGSLLQSGNLTATASLTLTQGLVNTQGNKISLGILATSEGTLTRTNGRVLGSFERFIRSSATATAFLFPVGTSIDYLPATISFDNLSAGGSLTINYITADPGDGGLSFADGAATVYHAFDEGYWDLTPSVIASTSYDLDLTVANFDSFVINPAGANRLLIRAGGAGTWTNPIPGVHVVGSATVVSRDNVNFSLDNELAVGAIQDCNGLNPAIAITGSISTCIGTSQAYSVVSPNTLAWTVTGGTFAENGLASYTAVDPSVTVNWDGTTGGARTLQVVESTTCETGSPEVLNVDVHPVPVTITGATQVLPNAVGESYSVVNRPDYTFTWAPPTDGAITNDNGNSILVTWSGTEGGSSAIDLQITYTGGGCATPINAPSLPVTFSSIFQTVSPLVSGSWNNSSSWTCNCIPPLNSEITIKSGSTIQLVDNLIAVTNLTIESGATLDNQSFLLTVNGDYSLSGTHLGSGSTVISGSSSGTIDGTGTKPDGALMVNKARSIAGGSSLTFDSDIMINPGVTITNNGTVNMNGDLQGANNTNAIWRNAASSTLTISGTFNSGRIDAAGLNNTVEYQANGNQNIRFPIGSPGQYYNLIADGAGTKTITGDLSVQSLTVDPDDNGDATLNGGSFILTINGDLTNNNIFTSNGTIILRSTTNPQTVLGTPSATSFTNLEINKPAGATFNFDPANTSLTNELTVTSGVFTTLSSADFTLSGNVVIETNGSLNASNIPNFAIAGNLIKNGSGAFTQGNNELIFNGTGNQILRGTYSLFDLTKTNGGSLTLNLGTTTVSNSLNLTNGIINTTSSNLLILNDNAVVIPADGSTGSLYPVRCARLAMTIPLCFRLEKATGGLDWPSLIRAE